MSNHDIWVFGDLRNDRFFEYSLNVLGKAKELSGQTGGKTAMVLVPGKNQECLLWEEAADRCSRCGADYVYVLQHKDLDAPRADAMALMICRAVSDKQPGLVFFPMTQLGRELAARTSRMQDAGLIADCVDMAMEDGLMVATCPSWGGRIMARITFAEGTTLGFATVAPHGFSPSDQPGDPGSAEELDYSQLALPKGLKLLSYEPEEAGVKRLEEAETVVVGGAGMGSADGFGLVRELAAALGGQVGATRPPVLSHWVEEERLIGQTGKTVRPRLLVSAATSGAVQYTAGIAESGLIVAINRDAKSPIFEIANIGVEADAKAFLPVFTAKAKKAVMRKLADDLACTVVDVSDSSFGATIKKLREGHDWTREALAQATGQTPEFIASVESDELSPSVSFLLRLARALGIDPGTFLRDEEKSAIRDQRAKAYAKRTQSYSYEVLTPDAENEHLRAFMITIESRKDHKPVEYKHEGEEFVFVLDGDLELTLDSRPHVLKPGESKRFNSEIPHKLKSLSDMETRCLVVLYTP
ncbi:Electron transfer flavoprotein (Etf), alpha subunit [Desulfatibacillum aliphaticivorans]|uniref:Electron transfer flavoprotein (Etf), alpha subunit n=1 Tax=Desulfatibacillum aliphaticivorans TaxID=218208 RepID=B8FE71_DESAL|nr:FAD-binding protein [Desulfatibacillum aliphaticivorans]ACL06852.1 Electron transfer flavoprotein (Etf), alpha subunit [Desulfatibacillum aliphaticivorans]